MADYKFADNHRDLCRGHGVDAGFQFEFYCERCSDTWRTEFKPYRAGQASGWLSQLSSVLGGWAHNAGRAADGVAQSGFSTARDAAFQEAIAEAERHFHRCAKCRQAACARCWDAAQGLCISCAPNVSVEVEAARRQGEIQAAADRARVEGESRGARTDVATDRQLVCPGCGTQTHGAKFCPECGQTLNAPTTCASCHAALAAGAKFCGECGTRV